MIKTDSISIKGNLEISDTYIQNYLDIKHGELYNESKIKKIDKRLSEIPFLKSKAPTMVTISDNKARINIFANKKNASHFDGILGFLPDNNKPGKILLTGDVRLQLINSFENGEQIDFRWRKLQSETQDLDASLHYPYIFNTLILQ